MEPWRQVLVTAWKDSRLTLDELAERSGLNRGTIHRILDDVTKDPAFNTIAKLTAAFGDEIQLRVARTLLDEPRPGQESGRASTIGGEGSGARIEDRLGDLLAYIKTLEGPARGDFIRAVVALLAAIEHTRPAAGSGETSDDGR